MDKKKNKNNNKDRKNDKDCIQNYIVKNMLGRGSFANVYKAKCKKTSQVVAIKMIEKKNLIDKDSLQGRVRTEISIHSRLKHPFILEMFSFFEDELYIYLVLEMCENGSLSNLLKTSPDFFTEDKVRQFMQQIVTAMLYLEKHRIVHRDLTLSNLLLDKEFSIKIADFGLAVQLDDLNEKHYTMCGTPNYISPEVALKSAHGLEADVWSLGCLFYTMLVGTPPFDANDIPKTLNKVICADLFIPFSVSTQAASLIRALLQKHPNNRCKLSQILEHPFMKTQIVTLHTKKVSGSHASTDSGKGGLQTSSSISQTNKHSKTKKLNNNSSSASKLSSDDGVDCSSSTTTTTTTIVQQLPGFNYDSHSNIPTCGESSSKNKWRKKSTKPPPSYLNHTNHKPRSRSYDQCTKRHDDVSSSQQLTNYNNVFNIPSSLDKHASSTSRLLEDGADNRSNFFSHSTPVNVLNRPISIQPQQEASSSRSVKQHKKKTANFGPPLSTLRLLATRKKTHKTMLTITKEGWVVIEFTQMFASNMYVTSVTFISGDGQQIKYFACKSGEEMLLRPDRPVVNLASPVPNVPCEVYTFNQLPKRLWNIYKYASQFVNTVRSVTPTVIYYTDKAKCMLMENNRFVANFYDGVTFTQLQSKMTITESDDRTTTFDVSASISQMLPDTQDRWNHVIEVYKMCRALVELLLASNPKLSSSSPFPCFLGRQPTGITIASSSTSAASKKNCGRSNSHASINNEATLSPFSIRSYSSSNVTATSTPTSCGRTCTSVDTFTSDSLASAEASNRPSTTFDCQKQPHIKYLSLPDVGNVYEYPRGFFVIERLDETCILLDSQADSYTFKLKSGSTLTFCKVADVPSSYRRMLDDLPHILQLLARTKPLTSFSS